MKRILAAFLALPALVLAATTTPVQLLNPAGSTAGQAIVSNGPSSAPTWQAVTATALAPVAANTVIANATGSSAAPTAHAVPSCSTANSALNWTSASGFGCGTTFALTSGNLSQFAATTSAQLLGVLSDETGSGAAVFGTSPALTTPAITGGTINNASVGATTPSTGAFTTLSASGTLSANGGLTVVGGLVPSQTAGIVGTTTNNNANAGSVGENPTNSTTGTALTSGAAANCTTLPLTAGDWEVEGTIQFVAAGTTTIQQLISGIGTASATLGGVGTSQAFTIAFTTGSTNNIVTPTVRFSLAAPGTAYLVGLATFGVSTMTCNGSIRARRPR